MIYYNNGKCLEQWGPPTPRVTPLPTFSNVLLPEPYNFLPTTVKILMAMEKGQTETQLFKDPKGRRQGPSLAPSNEAFPL